MAASWASTQRSWFLLAFAVTLLKLVFLFYDPWPMVFMGDSGTYLYTAFTGNAPEDRSFLYGALVRVFGIWPGSFSWLVIVQSATGVITAVLLSGSLQNHFSVHRSIAWAAAFCLALDPLQLMYERFVMTESFSLLVFALYCTQTFRYFKKPRLLPLVLLQATGTLLISLRLSFLIPILINTLIIPILGALSSKWSRVNQGSHDQTISGAGRLRWQRLAAHLSVCVLATLAFHSTYQNVCGFLLTRPPAYQYADGFWLVSVWAPVIRPEDSPYPQFAGLIERGHEFRLRDIYVRNGQRFSKKGLVGRLCAIETNTFRANRIARHIALNALKRDPIGVARLAIETYLHFMRKDIIPVILRDDEGFRSSRPDRKLEQVATQMGSSVSMLQTMTPTKRYHSKCTLWYQCLLHTPLLTLVAAGLCQPESRAAALFLLVTSTTLFVTICALSTQPVFRYLHPFSFVFLLSCGVLLNSWFPWNVSST